LCDSNLKEQTVASQTYRIFSLKKNNMKKQTISRPDTNTLVDSNDQEASMQVIRDLLFGSQQKSNDARLTALSNELDRLERLILEKANQTESALGALEQRLLQARKNDLDDMSDAIVGIGQSIKGLGVTQ